MFLIRNDKVSEQYFWVDVTLHHLFESTEKPGMFYLWATVILNIYWDFSLNIRKIISTENNEGNSYMERTILKSQTGCMPSCFLTNTAEGFTLWYPGLQIKCQIQFATENMKCVTALRGITWQHNFIIGVCPNAELKYKKKCYLTAVIS